VSKLLFFVLGSLVTLTLGFGWHAHRGRFGHGPWTPEHVREGVSWVLRGVDASDAQVDAIADIVDEAAGDLERVRDRHHEQLEALAEALAAPEIDRAALDKIRSEAIALADETSGRVVTALADASAQLTPEQRSELLERHERLHERWHGSR
jgi:Spy/CpxP family protein refolding chaperone